MATVTTNLQLTKPATTDFYDIGVQNTNMDLLDTAVAGKANTVHVHGLYGACATGASTKAKTLTLRDFALSTGALVVVKFNDGNTSTAPTLNVNGTGAKTIYFNGAPLKGDLVASGNLVSLIYDGAYWQVMDINAAKGKIVSGSYVGTGTYGTKNPTVVDLGMVPKMVIIGTADNFAFSTSSSNGTTNYFHNSCMWLEGQPVFRVHDTWDVYINYVSFSGTAMTWNHKVTDGDYPARGQLNDNGIEYFFVAFG